MCHHQNLTTPSCVTHSDQAERRLHPFDLPYVSPGHYRIAVARYDTYGNLDGTFGVSGAASASAQSAAALTDAALADTGRQQLALAALLQYEDQLQSKPAPRSKGLELPAVDLALADLAS